MLLKTVKKNKVFKFLASLKLAVILLVALAAILAVATFYESIYDTKTAQYLVYRSPLFALFLAVLGINLTCSALMRFPWRKNQTGFVMTHLGIILILLGSLMTMAYGVDGSMALEEGETANKVTIDQPVIYFGRDLDKIQEINAEYRWNRPEPGRSEHRYELGDGSGLVAVIDDYYHHAKAETSYVSHTTGAAALKLRLFNDKVDQEVWLTTADGKLSLGPASIEFFRLPDAEAVEAFSKAADFKGRGTLQLLINDEPLLVDLDRVTDKPYPLEVEGATLQLVRYLPHAAVEDDDLISRSDEPVNPAVELILTTAKGTQTWLLFALLPELNTRIASTGEEVKSQLLYVRKEKDSKRSLEVGLTPEGSLRFRVDGERTGAFNTGETIATGWMNLQAEVQDFVPKARRQKNFREVFPKKGKEDKAPGPAIRLTLEGAAEPGPYWLERGDIRRLDDKNGQEIIIGYGYKAVPLGFDIKLKDFRIGYDPGTKTAASYESDVVVDEKVHTIAMNEPLHRDGYTVFQASFADGPSGGMISVFSIANDPGIELKYGGSIVMVLGIIIMFYFKPKKVRVAKEPSKEPGAVS